MGLWTCLSMVVYRVYHGREEMEGGAAHQSSVCEGSRTSKLDATGQREITVGLYSRAAKGGDGA
jgi:hypothetical protein